MTARVFLSESDPVKCYATNFAKSEESKEFTSIHVESSDGDVTFFATNPEAAMRFAHALMDACTKAAGLEKMGKGEEAI